MPTVIAMFSSILLGKVVVDFPGVSFPLKLVVRADQR